METSQHPATAEQLSAELEHPSANGIWQNALEVFGDEAKARHWMNSPRNIFEDRSPQELAATGDPTELRRILEVPIRIDYGVYS